MSKVRDLLITKMSSLELEGVDCSSCSTSECCTFVKNSMMITPLETVELIQYLNTEGRINRSFLELLKTNILDYRLDVPLPGNGVRNYARRSYTCPFLKPGALACSISRSSKPYGCLGYNATTKNSIDSTNCRSSQTILSEIDIQFSNYLSVSNTKLKQLLDINFEKLAIPQAILNVLGSNSLESIISIDCENLA